MPAWLEKFLPILGLLIVVAVVLIRLPKVKDVVHSAAFRHRRVLNWLPLGLTYAFLYWGRYNLKVGSEVLEHMRNSAGEQLMDSAGFATIFGWGTIIYGFAFLINGPMTDRLGGRKAILIGAAGAAVMNLVMAAASWSVYNEGVGHEWIGANFVTLFSILYAVNMYFQSFGAVAIVKVNAPWFHVRERGVFGAIFGILISLGVYFAFDFSFMIVTLMGADENALTAPGRIHWVFLAPAIALVIFWVLDFFMVRNTPGEAGQEDFNTADASSGSKAEANDDEVWAMIQRTVEMLSLPPLTDWRPVKLVLIMGTRVYWVFVSLLTNPIVLIIASVEFCSGFLRQAIMQWGTTFAKHTDSVLNLRHTFVFENWGMLLCCAGILGGVFAGIISDHLFQSRRGPVATILYAMMLLGAVVLTFTYQTPMVGWLVVFMSMCVIGVHGMLSGTASMDFGGSKNVGIAVGIIDGFVYLGTAVMAFTYRAILPGEELDEAGHITGDTTQPENWIAWPIAMIPIAVLGLILATRVWNAKPKGQSQPKESEKEEK